MNYFMKQLFYLEKVQFFIVVWECKLVVLDGFYVYVFFYGLNLDSVVESEKWRL